MRLTPQQRSALPDAFHRSFGPAAQLWLFGSRTDDSVRGGDHDFLVQFDQADAGRLTDARLALVADLHVTPWFGDEKLDVVPYSTALDRNPGPLTKRRCAMALS